VFAAQKGRESMCAATHMGGTPLLVQSVDNRDFGVNQHVVSQAVEMTAGSDEQK
jgi:hypothetical protein